MVCTAIGFLAFYGIEKLTTLHVGHETATEMDRALCTTSRSSAPPV